MNRAAQLARTLFNRRWWWVTLLVIAMMILLARLGVWQLDRLAQRRAANAALVAALNQPPIPLNDDTATMRAYAPRDVPPDLADREVMVSGTYAYEDQLIVKLQPWQGQPGVHLITPLRIEGSDAAVLVDRGWIPDSEYEAGHRFDDRSGSVTVKGYIALTETLRRGVAVDPVTSGIGGDEVYRVDIAAIQDELPYPLLPFYVKESPPEAGDGELPLATPREIDLSEGPHLSYAIQWFIFSVGLGVAYVIFVNRSLSREEHTPSESYISRG